jgi:alkanesulfonate monooxygenase SsuD/methylene tetrahydromethanopterin reductase-like flavin-dependent oxidoreductase (luciferase family)
LDAVGSDVDYRGLPGGASGNPALAKEAERLGYSTVWAAEGYGSDAVPVLTWIEDRTSLIDLGSAILQIRARTPAMPAMSAATLDSLTSGRFRLGLGVSGPQVSEGCSISALSTLRVEV